MTLSVEEVTKESRKYKISILTCNIQSANKNFDSVKDLIYKLELPKIINLVEIWQPKLKLDIQGYHEPINYIRQNKRGGGLSLIIHESLRFKKYEIINQMSLTQLEKIALEITEKNGKKFILISCYRAPNSNLKKSFEEFEYLLEKAHLSQLPVVITGDMNVNLNKNDHTSKNYIDILQKYQFVQIIKESTRIVKNHKSLIDHILINSKIGSAKAHTICFSIADHLPTFMLWGEKKEKEAPTNEKVKRLNYKKLEESFKNFEIKDIEKLDSNKAFNKLHEKVTEEVNKCKYEIPKKQRQKNPWISEECIKLGRDLIRLKHKFIKINSTYNEYLYKKTKREYQKMIRKEKNNYYKTKIENCRGDSHKIWQTINELLNRKCNKGSVKNDIIINKGNSYKTDFEIAQFMNKYYKNIAIEIEDNLEKSNFKYEYYLNKSPQTNECFEIQSVTEEEILKTIKSMSNKVSEGPDGISNKIIKKISPWIIKELAVCINKSFREACFPEKLRISKLTPVFKKGDRTSPSNWRPIAQLSPFSKAYEKTFLNQLNEQSHFNKVINSNQFGFRSKHSTVHPCILIKNYIELETQKKNYVVMITLDIKKAFDCVKTNGLLQNKIKYYTKSEGITKWIDSYYENRKQSTKWGTADSQTVDNHKISIVQGSNLGSKMFNFYINDLPNIPTLEKLMIFLFADDCVMLIADHDLKNLEKLINEELITIKDYYDSNFLSISIEKSNFMIFKPKNKRKTEISLKIGNEILVEKDHLTYLGVIFDNKLSFKEHFNKIYEKIKKGLNGLIMTKNQLNYRAKINIYHSLIHSHLSYCSIIWLNNINKTQVKMLKNIQKKAIRIIHGARYNEHTDELFQKSRITKVENIFELQSLILTFNYQQRKLPDRILELFDKSLQNYNIQTRYLTNRSLKPNNELKSGNLMFEILNNWNNSPKSLRDEQNLKTFKKILRDNQNQFKKCDIKNCNSCR